MDKLEDEHAVYVRNACKYYGRKSKRKQVLQGLNMTVERGCIYGLLGASGCGKTTLLSCIVGRRLFNSGELWVLGGTPSTEESGVPGPRVGYMPQETALVGELTIRETITFFGRLSGMSESRIKERYEELSQLLDLPPHDQWIVNLSGGQQRRVSLAASLIHQPELLILDEPTVGLDPILRHNIWEYLIRITNDHKTTVIITTHYIEECRQAHKIGLMRHGRLLADGSPEDVIARYGVHNLEEVFLLLSRKQNEDHRAVETQEDSRISSTEHIVQADSLHNVQVQDDVAKESKKHKARSKKAKIFRSFTIEHERLKSLFIKALIQIIRNKPGLFMVFFLPVFQCVIFFLSVGGAPKGLPLAVVNEEQVNCLDVPSDSYKIYSNDSYCDFQHLSCKFLQELDDPLITKVYFADVESAIESVKHGKTKGVIYFPKQYTQTIKHRIFDSRGDTNDTFEIGKLQVWLDMSNVQFGPPIKVKLIEKYIEMQKTLLTDCDYNPHNGEVPLKLETPVYGDTKDSYIVFCLPGNMISLVFYLACLTTSAILVLERLEGVWDRVLVAGATTAELLLNHVLIQLILLVLTTSELLVLVYVIFRFTSVGGIGHLAGIMFAQGVCGMSFGFLISAVSNSFTEINSISSGIFMPLTLVSGVMWPIEGMPVAMQKIAYILPFAYPVEAYRSISMRGWPITNPAVFTGYLMPLVWSIIYILLTFYFLKRKM